MQTQKIKTQTAECRNCPGKKRAKDFSSKTILGNKVLVCKKCGYYNSSEIFFRYDKLESGKQLIFGQD